jgi:predicted nucleic acid-binding protein
VILVDTTPLVALCDARDSYHERAVRHLAAMAPSSFGTCDGVLAEACCHLPHAAQRLRLRALLDQLDLVALPAAPDGPYRAAVFDWLARYAEHEPDWADGCLAVLCGRDAAASVWTYDVEFRTTWRRPDGTPIPLASA